MIHEKVYLMIPAKLTYENKEQRQRLLKELKGESKYLYRFGMSSSFDDATLDTSCGLKIISLIKTKLPSKK